ncbi:uncharacterized protein LTR77_011090 [Saxophila tyrrhenica]|uniref:RBR-type E3 ubiquitin transferase n=1 Tax=Saxophila tyrrhenica TaxID=1690608 RepID=A0AAV9NW84_9PEZI|nr:hypothetical protein LTR77_011090 [Saxophila tyrrhenica]
MLESVDSGEAKTYHARLPLLNVQQLASNNPYRRGTNSFAISGAEVESKLPRWAHQYTVYGGSLHRQSLSGTTEHSSAEQPGNRPHNHLSQQELSVPGQWSPNSQPDSEESRPTTAGSAAASWQSDAQRGLPEDRTDTESGGVERDSIQSGTHSESRINTCISCNDELWSEDSSDVPLTSQCAHEISACRACVQHWIETQVDDNGVANVRCLECRELLTHADVQQHATRQTFSRYDGLVTRAALGDDPEFVWCRNSGCGAGQIHVGGEDAPLFRCRACDYRYCIACDEPWHVGETCEAFTRRMDGGSVDADGHENDDNGEDTFPGPSQIDLCDTNGGWQQEREAADRDLALAWSHTSAEEEYYDESSRATILFDTAYSERAGYAASYVSDADSQPSSRSKRTMKKLLLKEHTPSGRGGAGSEACSSVSDTRSSSHSPTQYQHSLAQRQQRNAGMPLERSVDTLTTQEQLRQAAEVQRRAVAEQERAAYQKRREDERRGEETVRKHSKPCPSCRWQIQKASGCEHMVCSKCRYEFCYLCLASYESIRRVGNSAHATSCKLYRRPR